MAPVENGVNGQEDEVDLAKVRTLSVGTSTWHAKNLNEGLSRARKRRADRNPT